MKKNPNTKPPAQLPPPAGAIVPVPDGKRKAGRSSFWITPDRLAALEKLLEGGATDRDMCERLGLSQSSFYTYCQTGRAMKGLEAMPKTAPSNPVSRALCLELLETVTRARATARLKAINAIMNAIEGAKAGERTTVTYSETILDRQGYPVIDPETKQPMMYTKQTITEKVIQHPPDWRAGIEYLARRDKTEWSERFQIQNVDFETEVINGIKAGELDYIYLLEEFKNPELVNNWFKLAGVKPGKVEVDNE